MSGIAMILPNADFSVNNIGKVTILQDVAVEGIAIVANESYESTVAKLGITYTPAVTKEKGVTWSITSGSEYASINPSTGEVSIKSNAKNNQVTVKAVSLYNSEITDTKTISVTYKETVEELTSISISGNATVTGTYEQYAVVTTPTNSAYKGVTWSIESGSQYATINSNGKLTILEGASSASVTIKAVSTHDELITATKEVTVTYQDSSVLYNLASPATITSGSNLVDTGVKLFDSPNKPWTIFVRFGIAPGANYVSDGRGGWNPCNFVQLEQEKNKYIGINNTYRELIYITTDENNAITTLNSDVKVYDLKELNRNTLVFAFDGTNMKAYRYNSVTGLVTTDLDCEASYNVSDGDVILGGSIIGGTTLRTVNLVVDKCKILDYAVEEEDVLAKVNAL